MKNVSKEINGMIFDYSIGDYDNFANDTRLSDQSDSWSNATVSEAKSLMKHGYTDQVERSQALLDRVNLDIDFDAIRKIWTSDVVGVMPNIPAYLAGVPETMFRQEDDLTAQGEIVIYCDCFISASYSADAAQRRGAALLALVQFLSTIRPVRLLAGALHVATRKDSKNRFAGAIVELPTAPLDLARAGYALSHIAFYRRNMLGILSDVDPKNFTASWRSKYDTASLSDSRAYSAIKGLMDADNVILTPDLVSADGTAPFETDAKAAAWVQKEITKVLQKEAL